MLPSPTASGPDRPGRAGSDHSVVNTGLLAAPVAGPVPASLAAPEEASVLAGGCFARVLPLDPTCSRAARSYFREAVAGMGLPGDLAHDGVTMASELAANTLHAQENVEYSGSSHLPVSGCPEFWLYLRGAGTACELVCKVFDSQPGWNSGELPDVNMRTAESVNGRGLQVVAGLSAGQWGAHLTRGRLGSWKVPGKVVWFGLRVPPSCEAVARRRLAIGGDGAVDDLEAMLIGRGLGGRLVRANQPGSGISVLSIARGLTVWCHGDRASWRAPDGHYERRSLADLVEVAELIVCAHEELRAAASRA
jgi:hypothetical protein